MLDDDEFEKIKGIQSESERGTLNKTASEIKLAFAENLPVNIQNAALDHARAMAAIQIATSKDEVFAYEQYFFNPNLTELWLHFDRFELPENCWGKLIDIFIEAYAYPEQKAFENSIQEKNADAISNIAEVTDNLLHLIQQHEISFALCPELQEVAQHIERAKLEQNLLRLLTLTTACQWPALEYKATYLNDSEEAHQAAYDMKFDETRHINLGQRKIISTTGATHRLYRDGKDHYLEVFRPKTEPYDHNQEVKPGEIPPPIFPAKRLVTPPESIKTKKSHLLFLSRIVSSLDALSQSIGRPKREKNQRPGKSSPLYLPIKQYHLLVEILFNEYLEDSQITRVLNRQTTSQ